MTNQNCCNSHYSAKNDTEEYNSRLIHSEDNPGWLWDPVESEWVADSNNPPGGDS